MDNKTAWIVLMECYGEDAVRGVKPSQLTARQIKLAEDLLRDVIEAYRGENWAKGLLGMHTFSKPGVLSTGLAAVRAAYTGTVRETALQSSALPFYEKHFFEWMQTPSQKRGLVLRKYLPHLSDGSEDTPAGWNGTAAAETMRKNAADAGWMLRAKLP